MLLFGLLVLGYDLRNIYRFAVSHTCDVADESSVLVSDLHFHCGYFVMVGDAYGLSREAVSLFGTGDEHDAIVNTESKLSMTVHKSSNGQVGQGEQGPTLTDISSIQMILCDSHFCYSVVFIHLCDSAPCISSKPIVLI